VPERAFALSLPKYQVQNSCLDRDCLYFNKLADRCRFTRDELQGLARALGLSRTPRVIIFQKTVNINAPLQEIYGLLANPENFPHIFERWTMIWPRLKSLFENGKTTVHHRRITTEEVEERIKSNEEACDTGRSGILKMQER
jgi:hypothetical protein